LPEDDDEHDTQLIVADQPALLTFPSEWNTKVKVPDVAVIVGMEMFPEYLFMN
jgi:hypothetical protein